jgi:hypothetical protein
MHASDNVGARGVCVTVRALRQRQISQSSCRNHCRRRASTSILYADMYSASAFQTQDSGRPYSLFACQIYEASSDHGFSGSAKFPSQRSTSLTMLGSSCTGIKLQPSSLVRPCKALQIERDLRGLQGLTRPTKGYQSLLNPAIATAVGDYDSSYCNIPR